MFENYIKYQDITQDVLKSLRKEYDEGKIAPMLQAREALLMEFEAAGWPDTMEAEEIIRETLRLERECVKIIAARRKALKEKMNGLTAKKYALEKYTAQVH